MSALVQSIPLYKDLHVYQQTLMHVSHSRETVLSLNAYHPRPLLFFLNHNMTEAFRITLIHDPNQAYRLYPRPFQTEDTISLLHLILMMDALDFFYIFSAYDIQLSHPVFRDIRGMCLSKDMKRALEETDHPFFERSRLRRALHRLTSRK